MNWNDGYIRDVPYAFGYFAEMNPAYIRFLLLMAGLVPPQIEQACEPGYGQGLSLNIHAAAESTIWWGTDFNPSHAALAEEMAAISGARCFAESFQDFCQRDDLPEFDLIALHGVWSWISRQNQQAILELFRRKLRVGGAVYIAYNTAPGWQAFKPVRDLLKLYADINGGSGGNSAERIDQALGFMRDLTRLNPGYMTANPSVGQRLEAIGARNGAYLAHELFNDDWAITSFAEMNALMADSRLSYACSAQPLGVLMGLGMDAEQRRFVAGIKDPVLRESVLDFMYNVQFRQDLWIKGPRNLGTVARNAALREEQFILLAPMTDISRQIRTNMGEITLTEGAHAVIAAVMKDGKPHSGAEFEKMAQQMAARETAPDNIDKENLQTLLQSMLVLMAGGLAAPVQKKADIVKARPVTDKLNFMLCQRAIDSGEITSLASPVLGGGCYVARFSQLFLLAIKRGARTSEIMAAFARDCLNAAKQNIVVEGNVLADQDHALEYLQEQADIFITTILPVLKNLQIV